MAAYRRVDDLRSPACTPGSATGPTLGIEYGKAFSLYIGLWLVLGLELRVGYSYRVWEECAYTRTDGKNRYGLSILYTQPKGKTRLATFTLVRAEPGHVLGQMIATCHTQAYGRFSLR